MNALANVFTALSRAAQIAWKDLLMQFQSPVLLVFLVAMPLGMILLTGVAFKASEAHRIDARVAVVVPGDAAAAAALAEKLQHAAAKALLQEDGGPPPSGDLIHLGFVPASDLTEAQAEEEVRSQRLSGAVFFPDGPGASGSHLLVGPEDSVERVAVISTVEWLLPETGRPDGVRAAGRVVTTVSGSPPRGGAFSAFGQAVTGNGIMFILLNCIMSGGLGLIRERRQHTLDRLLIAPLSRGTILCGKILGVYLIGLLQALVIFGFGLLVLRVPMGDLLGVSLVTGTFILVGCALGLMMSALARREENVQLLGGPVGLIMAALGGGMFPLRMAPAWMQGVALLLPTGWAMQAYDLLRGGAGAVAVLPYVLVLVGFAAGFFLIGTRSLKWE